MTSSAPSLRRRPLQGRVALLLSSQRSRPSARSSSAMTPESSQAHCRTCTCRPPLAALGSTSSTRAWLAQLSPSAPRSARSSVGESPTRGAGALTSSSSPECSPSQLWAVLSPRISQSSCSSVSSSAGPSAGRPRPCRSTCQNPRQHESEVNSSPSISS